MKWLSFLLIAEFVGTNKDVQLGVINVNAIWKFREITEPTSIESENTEPKSRLANANIIID